MQSAAPHVLAVLDRAHTPGRAAAAAREAREAGFEHVSLDLIYGTPGETDDDWRGIARRRAARPSPTTSAPTRSIVEPGTRLPARVRRGELPAPDDDVAGRRYAMADAALGAAGLRWYEISNWAGRGGPLPRTTSATGAGATGGASGRARTRTSAACAGGTSCTRGATPSAWRRAARRRPARERLDAGHAADRAHAARIRLAEGLPLDGEDTAGLAGLLDPAALARGVARLTPDGRLLADHVARELLLAAPEAAEAQRERVPAQPVVDPDVVGEPPDDGDPLAHRSARPRRSGRVTTQVAAPTSAR